jgi:molybdopterin/thiamine biosynthesis adenylyltransferase
LNDAQLLRYSRHILLDEISIEGQQRLLASHALIVGAGGLGSPVAMYLGSSGVGQLTVVDHDTVDTTNLQRQIAHTLADVGQPKAQSIQQAIARVNPDVRVNVIIEKGDHKLLSKLVQLADVVIDCTDNFATRHAINRTCVTHGKPLVSGAAIRFDGQVTVYDPRDKKSPCYACVFPETGELEEAQCATMGVFAPLVGIIGSVQAAEALKLLMNVGQALTGRLLMLDAKSMDWSEIRMLRNADCPVCGHHQADVQRAGGLSGTP